MSPVVPFVMSNPAQFPAPGDAIGKAAPAEQQLRTFAHPKPDQPTPAAAMPKVSARSVLEQLSAAPVAISERIAANRQAALKRKREREHDSAEGNQHAPPQPAPSATVEATDAPPAPSATVEATEDAPGPGTCVICQHPLLMPGEEQQALECMHVFHKKCIEEYIDTMGKPARLCCPFKCFKDLHITNILW